MIFHIRSLLILDIIE